MNLILKRDPVWLECLPTPDVSATLLILGGDGQQVAVPVPLLLAVSPVVRSILTDHLPPAYSPCCLSLPATTGDVLQVFGDILATGAAVGAHKDKIEEVRQVFEMLGVEAWIVSSHLESIQVGQVLDRDIKNSAEEVSGMALDEENTCQLEIMVKIEPKANIGVKVESGESGSIVIGEPCRLNITKKSSLNIQQSPSSTDKSSNLKNNANQSESKKRKKSPLSPMLSHPTPKKPKHPTKCKSTAPPVISEILVPAILRFAPVTQRIPRNPPTAFKAPKSNSDKPPTAKPKSPGSLKLVHNKVQFLCNLCPKKFVQEGHLMRHVKSVHDKIELSCKLCPQKFTLRDSLLKHVKSVHDKTRKFTHKSSLKKHVDFVHHKFEIPCKLCPKKFTWRDSLVKHVKAVHDKIEILCKLCPKKFTWNDTLLKHVKSVHDKIKYPCSLCPQQFTYKHHVVRHIKTVHKKQI